MDREFKGKNIIITGASRGLGLELAKEFFACGANVCLCSRNTEELEKVVGESQFSGGGYDSI